MIPFQSEACISTLNEEQKEILIYMMRVDSEFSKDLHIKFWAPNKDCSVEQKEVFSKRMTSIIPLGLIGQKAKWLSVRKSLEKNEVVFDSSFQKYLLRREEWLKLKGKPLDTLDQEKKQLEGLIKSSLESELIDVGEGVVVIDMAAIDQILEGIDRSFQRLNILFSLPAI